MCVCVCASCVCSHGIGMYVYVAIYMCHSTCVVLRGLPPMFVDRMTLLPTSVYARLTGLQPSRESPVSSSHLMGGALGLQMFSLLHLSAGDPNSRPHSFPSPQRENTFSSHVAYDEKNTERRFWQCGPEVNSVGQNRFISQYWGLRIFTQQFGLRVSKYHKILRWEISHFFQTGIWMPSLLFDFNMTALLILTVCYHKSIHLKVAVMGECNALH